MLLLLETAASQAGMQLPAAQPCSGGQVPSTLPWQSTMECRSPEHIVSQGPCPPLASPFAAPAPVVPESSATVDAPPGLRSPPPVALQAEGIVPTNQHARYFIGWPWLADRARPRARRTV